jgi:hypothetical protein
MKENIPSPIKKEISRLRSEVRNLKKTTKDIVFGGAATGNYWTATGMPWASGEIIKSLIRSQGSFDGIFLAAYQFGAS